MLWLKNFSNELQPTWTSNSLSSNQYRALCVQFQSNPKPFHSIDRLRQLANRPSHLKSFWMVPNPTFRRQFDSCKIDAFFWLDCKLSIHSDRCHLQLSYAIEYQFDPTMYWMYQLLICHPVSRYFSQNFRMQMRRSHRMVRPMCP